MAQMNPSPSKPVVRYPTALLEDKELITTHDTRLPDYKALEYGTPYPDQNKFPGLKLIFQEPLGEDDRMVRRVWAGDRQDQDFHNSDRKYSGGSTEHPIIVRRYVFPEDGYAPIPTGTPDSQFPDAVLVEEEVARPENRNGYLAVTRVFETLPGPALSGVLVTDKGQLATITTQVVAPGTTVTPSALTVSASVKPDSKGKSVLEKVELANFDPATSTFLPGEVFSEKSLSIERPDPVPEKFRVAIPTTTDEQTLAGTAVAPKLLSGDLAKTEQQLTQFTKRTQRRRRSAVGLPRTLSQTKTADNKLTSTVSETLRRGDTARRPTATTSVDSEALGDGTYLETLQDSREVFAQPAFTAEIVDPIPDRFKTGGLRETEESTVIGTARRPNLDIGAGDLSATEEQVDKFLVRKRKVKRNTKLTNTLSGVRTDDNGVVVRVKETLVQSLPSTQPTALKSVSAEQLGDRLFLAREEDAQEVFARTSFSVEAENNIPPKFRSELETLTQEKTEIGTATAPKLDRTAGEIAATETQETKFTKRVRRATRKKPTGKGVKLTQKNTNQFGQLVTVEESLESKDTTDQPSSTVTIESENLGGGNFIVRKSKVPKVFPQKEVSTEVDEVLPERFRASIPRSSQEETVEGKVGNSATLQPGQVAKSEAQVTEFTKRVRTVTRETRKDVSLKGESLDESLGVQLPFTEKIVSSGHTGDGFSEVTPLSKDLAIAKTYDREKVISAIKSRGFSYPSIVNISLPDTLEGVTVHWVLQSGNTVSNGRTGFMSGTSHHATEARVVGEFTPKIRSGFSGPVSCTVYVEYLQSSELPNITRSPHVFVSQLGAPLSRPWPTIRPEIVRLIAIGTSLQRSWHSSRSFDAQGTITVTDAKSESAAPITNSITIPPTIHGDLTISEEVIRPNFGAWVTGSRVPMPRLRGFVAGGSKGGNSIGKTNMAKFPTGQFVYKIDASPYRFGFVRVEATVVNITSDMV